MFRQRWPAFAFAAIQAAFLMVLCFGDIGFDHPGRFGLDFDDAVIILAIYGVVLVAGIGYSCVSKRWGWVAAQLALPVVVYAGVTLNDAWRRRPLDPASYQHLVGKSKAEVHAELGGRERGAGMVGDLEVESYTGMTVHYSRNGRVEAVDDSRF